MYISSTTMFRRFYSRIFKYELSCIETTSIDWQWYNGRLSMWSSFMPIYQYAIKLLLLSAVLCYHHLVRPRFWYIAVSYIDLLYIPQNTNDNKHMHNSNTSPTDTTSISKMYRRWASRAFHRLGAHAQSCSMLAGKKVMPGEKKFNYPFLLHVIAKS